MSRGFWVGGVDGFDKRCSQIARDYGLFKTFKQDGKFRQVVGNDVRPLYVAQAIYNHLKQTHPDLVSQEMLVKFLENDELGSPITHNLKKVEISAGTLIFIMHLSNIIDAFGKDIKSVVEIGSGYGGQALIINKYFPDLDYYGCVDTDGALELCDEYLSHWGDFIEFHLANENLPRISSDLVVSNYCLNEMNEDGVDFYVNKLLRFTDNIYLACGNFSEEVPRNKYLLDKLGELFDIEVREELPKITNHNNIIITGKKK